MDKNWIKAHITSETFKEGVKSFIEFARARSIRGVIACPCLRCCNVKHWDVGTCHGHILRYGFLPGYTNWSVHGETSEPLQPSRPSFVQNTTFGDDEIRSLVHDALVLVIYVPEKNVTLCCSLFRFGLNSFIPSLRLEFANTLSKIVGLISAVSIYGRFPTDRLLLPLDDEGSASSYDEIPKARIVCSIESVVNTITGSFEWLFQFTVNHISFDFAGSFEWLFQFTILWVFLDLFQSTKNLTFGFKEEFARSSGVDATLAKREGKLRNGKVESSIAEKLLEAQDEYDEVTRLCVFRVKSLKEVEPFIRNVAEKHRIDYQLTGLPNREFVEGEPMSGYEQKKHGLDDDGSSPNQMEEATAVKGLHVSRLVVPLSR
ncbi:hypothetical protein CTI12_AA015970 [Artemisia annua]|uniref:Transposase-associated domain-containing protein n=1 Tax=Artemisia annua TaxID=35608 RepID=A0A2U1Q470_ARTAN|nr:hypothetical protein CTI12_AA015970 [Artemisia annua]